MRRNLLTLAVAAMVAIGFSCAALAQGVAPGRAPAAGAKRKSNSKADELLRQMADYVGKLPAFSCHVESDFELKTKDHDNKSHTKMTVRLQRPNRIAMIVEEGAMGMTVISDGKELTQYLPMNKRYVVSAAPPGFEGVTDVGADLPITMVGTTEVVIPTSGTDFYRNLMDAVVKSDIVGQEKVGDVLCNHCRFIQDDFDWDIWIEAGKQPLVRKVSLDLAKQMEDAGPQMKGAKISFVVTLSDWNVSPKFTPADFTFSPPTGAKKVDELIESREPPHPLLGRPAPSFVTTDVNGHAIDLKKYIGKNVVMLDFWATWCGPCVEAMPDVEEVAKEYAKKGLVFYAVNAGEEVGAVKQFLQESKLNPPVAMDLKKEIGPMYAVRGIPQTVLIGKDGKVQVVHVGYNSRLPKLLAREIDELLAGKDLATETLAKAEAAKNDSSDSAEEPASEGAAPASARSVPAQ
jgi:peroxiredoxin